MRKPNLRASATLAHAHGGARERRGGVGVTAAKLLRRHAGEGENPPGCARLCLCLHGVALACPTVCVLACWWRKEEEEEEEEEEEDLFKADAVIY